MSDHLLQSGDQFLQTEEVLQQLILELEHYKSSSQQLTLTTERVIEILDSCERLIMLCAELIKHNKEQREAIHELTGEVKEHTKLVLAAQETAMASANEKLDTLTSSLALQGKGINAVADTLVSQGAKLATQADKMQSVEKILQARVEPSIQQVQKTASRTRIITFILLALTLINGALATYILQLHLS